MTELIVNVNNEILKEINKMKQVAIYGAQMVAVSVYYALKTLYPDVMVTAFVVSNMEGNPAKIDGIPVMDLEAYERTGNKNSKILIALPENFHAEIAAALIAKGFEKYVCIDSVTEAEIMRRFYAVTGEFAVLSDFPKGENCPEVFVGMSKFYKDRQLNGNYEIPGYVYPVQAGAALTDVQVAELRDDKGDNISHKNVNYSELTAMYWIGKHMSSDYMGLFHYRRMLDVKVEDLLRLKENDIDVILPYPTVHYPNINEHHKRYLKQQDWDAMMQALKELAPEYARRLPEIFEKQFFYNYNMLIAKEKVFKDYCDWLFPILQRTEELSVPKGSERADRYIGYLGENLTTLYFMVNADKLKIVHTGRLMLI